MTWLLIGHGNHGGIQAPESPTDPSYKYAFWANNYCLIDFNGYLGGDAVAAVRQPAYSANLKWAFNNRVLMGDPFAKIAAAAPDCN